MNLSCARIKSEILNRDDVYLLLIAEDCQYCEQVLDAVHSGNVNLDHETIVVNTDRCEGQLDQILDWDATPMIAHLKRGKLVRKARGVDGILAFEKDKSQSPGNSASAAEETREEVKKEAPPTGMSIEDILRLAEQAPPVSANAADSVVAHVEQGQAMAPGYARSVVEEVERSPLIRA